MASRFRVAAVFEIAARGRCVAGDVLEGALAVGVSMRPQVEARGRAWRICGVEFMNSPSQQAGRLTLILEGAPPVDELQKLLPAGSMLVTDEPGSTATEARAADDR